MNVKQISRDCLQKINIYRKQHNLHELVYEEELEQSANDWCFVLRRIAKNAPSLYAGVRYGENVLIKVKALNNLTGWEIATNWFVEGYNYYYGIEGETSVNRNFTQLIWASTREFGLSVLFNEDGDAYIVGHFRPLGNINGVFKFNAFPGCDYKQPFQPSLEEMNIIGLRTHNIYRRRHSCPPMVLCHDLIASAQKWAEHIAPLRGKIQYSNRCSYSESIAVKFDPLGFICSRKVTDEWYAHGKHYDYINYRSGSVTAQLDRNKFESSEINPLNLILGPDDFDLFTQIIWKSSNEVGFGRASCDGYHYLVVHYRLPTTVSSFVDNVFGLSEDFA